MPFSALPDLTRYGTVAQTPAVHLLWQAVERDDLALVGQVVVTHWEELWWSLPPAALGEVVACLPASFNAEQPGLDLLAKLSRNGGRMENLEAKDFAGLDSTDIPQTAETVLLRAVGLRLAGRPWDAAEVLESSPESYAVFGQLREDTTAGRVPSHRVSVGLIALLGERFGVARQQLGAAARAEGPVRFPWVPRAASALLALTHALDANHPAAELWTARAEALPRTGSWAERRADEHLALAAFQVALDRLELEAAQQIVEKYPSPFDHSYLWPFAAEAYTQYHLLRGEPQAAQSMWGEIFETVPDPRTLQGAARRVMLQVPLRLSLATDTLGASAELMAKADTPDNVSLAILADYASGNVDEALNRAMVLLPQVQSNPRVLMRLLGMVAACHHALGHHAERDRSVDLLVAKAETLGLWMAVALSPDPLREFILDREIPPALRELLSKPSTGAIAPAMSEALTPAEVDLFRLVAAGRNRKEMSALLHLSENTVKTHLRHIYRKLGVSSRAQAVERANQVRALVLREAPDSAV